MVIMHLSIVTPLPFRQRFPDFELHMSKLLLKRHGISTVDPILMVGIGHNGLPCRWGILDQIPTILYPSPERGIRVTIIDKCVAVPDIVTLLYHETMPCIFSLAIVYKYCMHLLYFSESQAVTTDTTSALCSKIVFLSSHGLATRDGWKEVHVLLLHQLKRSGWHLLHLSICLYQNLWSLKVFI